MGSAQKPGSWMLKSVGCYQHYVCGKRLLASHLGHDAFLVVLGAGFQPRVSAQQQTSPGTPDRSHCHYYDRSKRCCPPKNTLGDRSTLTRTYWNENYLIFENDCCFVGCSSIGTSQAGKDPPPLPLCLKATTQNSEEQLLVGGDGYDDDDDDENGDVCTAGVRRSLDAVAAAADAVDTD